MIRAAATPKLFDREGAAAYLSISTRTLDSLQAQGHIIPKGGIDSKRRYLRDDLDAYAEGLEDWGQPA